MSTNQAATLPLAWASAGASFHSRRKTASRALSASNFEDNILTKIPIKLGANWSYKLAKASASRLATLTRSSAVPNSGLAGESLDKPLFALFGMSPFDFQTRNSKLENTDNRGVKARGLESYPLTAWPLEI
jgi:hypothetical protein